MERKFHCNQCNNEYTAKYYFLAPFCSERCEELFLDYAPADLIEKVYSTHKETIDSQEEMPYHNINTIYCESCRSTIDYGYIDDRVIITCSALCSDVFLDTVK